MTSITEVSGFVTYADRQTQQLVDLLNHRPLKTVFFGLSRILWWRKAKKLCRKTISALACEHDERNETEILPHLKSARITCHTVRALRHAAYGKKKMLIHWCHHSGISDYDARSQLKEAVRNYVF